MKSSAARLSSVLIVVGLALTSMVAAGGNARAEQDSDYEIKVGVRASADRQGTLRLRGTDADGSAPLSLSDEAEQDLAATALSTGRPVEELREEASRLPAFEKLLVRLDERFPGGVTGSAINRDHRGVVFWLQTAGSPSAALIAAIEEADLGAVEVSFGAPASASDLEMASEAWSAVAGNAPAVLVSTASRYDPSSGKLVFEYSPAEGASSEQVAAVLDEAFTRSARTQADGFLPAPVELLQVKANLLVEQTVVQGGRDLFRNGGRWCTAGFTAARTSNGNRGVTTAGHCGGSLAYNNLSGVITADPSQSAYPTYDTQFHRTLTGNGHTTNNQFRATATEDRVPSLVQNAPVGTAVCHWGGTSGYSCGTVALTNTCLSGTCGLDIANGPTCLGGDSGGPWFYASIARGTHVGIDQYNRCVFTRIGRVENALGVTILQ